MHLIDIYSGFWHESWKICVFLGAHFDAMKRAMVGDRGEISCTIFFLFFCNCRPGHPRVLLRVVRGLVVLAAAFASGKLTYVPARVACGFGGGGRHLCQCFSTHVDACSSSFGVPSRRLLSAEIRFFFFLIFYYLFFSSADRKNKLKDGSNERVSPMHTHVTKTPYFSDCFKCVSLNSYSWWHSYCKNAVPQWILTSGSSDRKNGDIPPEIIDII